MAPRRQPYYQHEGEPPRDALETLELQDRLVLDLLDKWVAGTRHLMEGDDVNARWERGSEVKLLLEHLAVREEAKSRVGEALHREGRSDLADQLEADGPGRREDIDALEKVVRGRSAMTLNDPETDRVVMRLEARARREIEDEATIVAAAADALGPAGQRDLPSDRSVRMHSVTRPSPKARWFDKVDFLRAVRAWYDHLRGSPHEGTSPKVDKSRDYIPGTKKEYRPSARLETPKPGEPDQS